MATHAAGGAAQPAESETWQSPGIASSCANGCHWLLQHAALPRPPPRKRIFTQKDVETALAQKQEFLPIWTKFVEQGDVPFVKILADGEDAEYQFRRALRESTSLLTSSLLT